MNEDINEFYRWARHMYATPGEKESTTHPINWITLVRYSDMFKDCGLDLPGLKPMIESMAKTLKGKKYKYVAAPQAFMTLTKPAKMPVWDKNTLAPIYTGTLTVLQKDVFYLTGFEGMKVPIKYCWIISEIKNGVI